MALSFAFTSSLTFVMAGLVPASHVFLLLFDEA